MKPVRILWLMDAATTSKAFTLKKHNIKTKKNSKN